MALLRVWMLTGGVGLGALLVLSGARSAAAQDLASPPLPLRPVLRSRFARFHIIDRLKRSHLYWGNTLALLLNPTRSVANVMGGKRPLKDPAWSEPGRSR